MRILLGLISFAIVFAACACEPDFGTADRLSVARGMAFAQRAPGWFPEGDRIVFSHRGGVYVIDSAGSRLERIDGGGKKFDLSYGPSVSPDGSRIAYADYKQQWEIVTTRPDGSDERRVTDNDTSDISPVWSPDGSMIVFVSHKRGTRPWEIKVLATEGSDPPLSLVVVEPDPADFFLQGPWNLELSPDGSRLAFSALVYPRQGDYRRDLYVVEWDGSNLTKLAEGTGMPSWSRDSRRIAFARRELWNGVYRAVGVYTIERDGTGLREVVAFPTGSFPWSESLSWSPDGSAILLGSSVIAADGSGMQELPGPPGYASWSPDGSEVGIYSGGRSTALIYTVAQDGSDSRVLVEQDGEGNLTAAGGRPLTTHEGG